MAYTSEEYYRLEYFGTVIPDSLSKKYLAFASDEVDRYTFDRLEGQLPEEEKLAIKIQKATCYVAEFLYKMDIRNIDIGADEKGKGKIVKSESVGAISVSYEVKEDADVKEITTELAKNKEIYRRINKYLGGTGLMYAGR